MKFRAHNRLWNTSLFITSLLLAPSCDDEDASETGDSGLADDEDVQAVTPVMISQLVPTIGGVDGGTPVEIFGEKFGGSTRVLFGGLLAEAVQVHDDGHLTAIAPPHALGTVEVTVGEEADDNPARASYRYDNPVTPSTVPETGGVWVTILAPVGQAFRPDDTVLFDGVASPAIVLVNRFVIRVMVPPHSPGPATLTLKPSAGFASDIPGGILYTSEVNAVGAPRLVSAIAEDNTHVRIAFSEAMQRGLAEDPANYGIVPMTVNGEAGGLSIIGAELLAGDSLVRLTTRAQSAVTYQLSVTNLRDKEGNVIAPPELLVDPAKTVFAGAGEAGLDPADADNDGISDADEQLGWSVFVTDVQGQIQERQVVSNPDDPDSDDDGVLDGVERAAGMDPTRPDTDHDTLGDFDEWNRYLSDPTRQDTDGDGLNDPTELFFLTSIVLEDTDGDQYTDYDEVVVRQRNPRIADLPQPSLEIGGIGLALDVRYAYTDIRGESHTENQTFNTTLQTESSTQSTTYGQWTQNFEVGGSVGIKSTISWTPKAEIEVKAYGKYGRQWTGGTDVVSSQSAISTYDNSISRVASFESTQSVTRTVEGAAITVTAYLGAQSDVAFTLKNLELTLLHGDPNDRSSLTPVASLVPNNPDLSVNLGPGVPRQGPLIFRSDEVFPGQVEALMRNPEAMVVRFANYDVLTEDGRNLAFISQDVEERTGTIVIDFGNGRSEEYRVALSNEWDPQTGKPVGLALTDALRAIGLDAGPCAGVAAAGMDCTIDQDCIDVFGGGDPTTAPVRCDTTGARNVCVAQNWCDDVLVVDTVNDPLSERSSADHDVTKTFGMRIQRDGLGVAQFDDAGQPIMDLARVRGVQAEIGTTTVTSTPLAGRSWSGIARSDYQHRWVMITDGEATESFAGVSFRPGGSYILAFTVDEDGDGLYKIEEQAFGTSDRNIDFDGDGLSDWEEVRGGAGPRVLSADSTRYLPTSTWNVETDQLSQYRVYPHALSGDSDNDGLGDLAEVLVHLTDPTKIDSDADGVSDSDEVNGWKYTDVNNAEHGPFHTSPLDSDHDGDGLIDGIEAIWETNPELDDAATVSDSDKDGLPDNLDVNCEQPGNPPDDDPDGDNDGIPDFLEISLGTNPCNADSDNDGINDLVDWDGVLDPSAEDHCSASLNCFLPERSSDIQIGTNPRLWDTDGDGLNDLQELDGWLIVVKTSSTTSGDDLTRVVSSDPLKQDTDGDGLSDMNEFSRKTDPRRTDTDGDGASDYAEVVTDPSRNPTYPDRKLRIRLAWIQLLEQAEGDNAEYVFSPFLLHDGDSIRAFGTNSMAASNRWSTYITDCGGGRNIFKPGVKDQFDFGTLDTWATRDIVTGLDQTIVLGGWWDEVRECDSVWESQCLFGGPADAQAFIPGNTAGDIYINFQSTDAEVEGVTPMKVQVSFHVSVVPL